MTAVAIDRETIKIVKHAIREQLPSVKSATLSEALACALGFRSHAALIATYSNDPEIRLFDEEAIKSRIGQLGGEFVSERTGKIGSILSDIKHPGVFRTTPKTGKSIPPLKSKRSKAWQAVMVAAVNGSMRRKLFTIRPADNRWLGSNTGEGVGFHFSIEDQPAYCHVRDVGFDELSIKVTVWPTQEVEKWGRVAMHCREAAYHAGDLYASGWLERRDGAWLQTPSSPQFFCRKSRIETVNAFKLEKPLCFAESGPFKM